MLRYLTGRVTESMQRHRRTSGLRNRTRALQQHRPNLQITSILARTVSARSNIQLARGGEIMRTMITTESEGKRMAGSDRPLGFPYYP
nr:hypothetical protein CFP56_50964 [Quercus suber]